MSYCNGAQTTLTLEGATQQTPKQKQLQEENNARQSLSLVRSQPTAPPQNPTTLKRRLQAGNESLEKYILETAEYCTITTTKSLM